MEDDVLWDEQHDKSDTDSNKGNKMYEDMMTHEQIQQMFSEESDDDEFCGFESILLISVHLIHECDLYVSIYCMIFFSIS